MAFAPGPNVALAPFFPFSPEAPMGFSAKITCGPPHRRLAKNRLLGAYMISLTLREKARWLGRV